MPHAASNVELPKNIQHHLPKQAQELYRETYNHVRAFYRDPRKRKCNNKDEQRIRSIAWCAVENRYKRIDNGDWVER